uniref:Uncharacterized protein n=1 Tax=Arundo donax TaxID=35708 RepID=A0A0A9P5S5_ARUDO
MQENILEEQKQTVLIVRIYQKLTPQLKTSTLIVLKVMHMFMKCQQNHPMLIHLSVHISMIYMREKAASEDLKLIPSIFLGRSCKILHLVGTMSRMRRSGMLALIKKAQMTTMATIVLPMVHLPMAEVVFGTTRTTILKIIHHLLFLISMILLLNKKVCLILSPRSILNDYLVSKITRDPQPQIGVNSGEVNLQLIRELQRCFPEQKHNHLIT